MHSKTEYLTTNAQKKDVYSQMLFWIVSNRKMFNIIGDTYFIKRKKNTCRHEHSLPNHVQCLIYEKIFVNV